MKYCQNCNAYYNDNTQFCPKCGAELGFVANDAQTPPPYGAYNQPAYSNDAFAPAGPEGKSRGVAALLAIFLGTLGVQYFYLGKVGAGLLTILLSAVSCGLWGLVVFIQGILMLCMTNEEFERKYVQSTSTLPLF